MDEPNELDQLSRQFATARHAEDARLRSLERVRISPWNPRTTMQWDADRRAKRINDLKRFTEAWWRARGYAVLWNDDADEDQLPSASVIKGELIESTGPS